MKARKTMSMKVTSEERALINEALTMNRVKKLATAYAKNSRRMLERRAGHYSAKRHNLPDNASAARR